MISTREQGQAIAIAAVTQSVEVAFDLARSLRLPESTLSCLTESLFQISAETPLSIYSAGDRLELGIRRCGERLEAPLRQEESFLATSMQIAYLAKELTKDPSTQHRLRAAIEAIDIRRTKEDSAELAQTVAQQALAELYQTHISPLGPKIILRGEPHLLQRPEIAAKIRTALLAGVRAMVLWRQMGGKSWHLVLRRKQLRRALSTIHRSS